MKILLASDTYLPLVSGNVIVVDQTARELAKRGHQVYLLVPGTQVKTQLKKEKNLTIFYTRAFKNPLRLNSYMPLAGLSAWRFIKQVNPDVIHAHTPGPLGLIARNFAQKYQIPLVFTVHGMPRFLLSYLKIPVKQIEASLDEVGWAVWRLILKPADVVITPSTYVADELKRYKVKNHLEVLPFWIKRDEDLLVKNKKTNYNHCLLKDKNKLNFLYYGRLDEDKNIFLLLKAWGKSSLAQEKAKLILVGKSKNLPELKKLVKRLKIFRSVKFLGMVPDYYYRQLGFKPDLPRCTMEAVFDQADFFITASNIETQNITGYLAYLFGLPIIASSAGAMPELVQKTPYPELIFQADDIDQLTKKINLVIKNKLAYRRYQPKKAVLSAYSKKVVITRLENIYRLKSSTSYP